MAMEWIFQRSVITRRLVESLGHLVDREWLRSDELWVHLMTHPPTAANFERWGWEADERHPETRRLEHTEMLQLEDHPRSSSSSSSAAELTAAAGKKEASAPPTNTSAAEPTATTGTHSKSSLGARGDT